MFLRRSVILTFIIPTIVQAQQPKSTIVVPATYPTIANSTNFGGKPGSTVELTIPGTNLANATGLWTSFQGLATIVDGKDATKTKVKLSIPSNAATGLYQLRLATESGISNFRPFIVDALPEISRQSGNNKKDTPQVVQQPCVITGVAGVEMGDYYKLKVNAGETLTFEAIGRRMGSAIDPVIILYDAQGREIPGAYADDTPGLQTDARLTHTFASAGEAIVEIRDTTYRGGADYTYRLRIGNFASATTAFPLAIERGKTAEIGFAGPQSLKPVSIQSGSQRAIEVSPLPNGWPVPLRVHDQPEAVEKEPNNTIDKANKLTVPGGISARFGEKNDLDFFTFTAKKGTKYVIQALTYELNVPTEVYLRVLDAKGAELAKSNPQQAGVRLEYTATADGDLHLSCEHTNYAFGPNEVYHLSVKPVMAEFDALAALDRFDVPVSGSSVLAISSIARLNGLAGNIELSLEGIDGVTGKLTVLPAMNATPAAPIFMPISASDNVKPGAYSARLRLTATVDGKPVSKHASMFDIAKAAMGGMPNPPMEFTTGIGIAVTPPSPLTIAVESPKGDTPRDTPWKGKVSVKRPKDFDGEITLSAVSLPAGFAPKFKPIPKGANEVELELTVAAAAALGPNTVVLKATAKIAGKDKTAIIPPFTVTVSDAKKKK